MTSMRTKTLLRPEESILSIAEENDSLPVIGGSQAFNEGGGETTTVYQNAMES